MKKLIILIILLTIHIFAFTSVVDSLTTALKEPNADKGDIYINLSAEYLNISPDKSVEYAKSALEYAESSVAKVKCLNQLGVAYEYSGKYQEALHEYSKALKLSESSYYTKGTGVSLINIAIAKTQLADYDNALDFALRAIKIFEKEDDQKHLTSALNNLGNIYLQINDFSQALHYYEIVLQNRQETDNEPGIAKILHNIALVHIGLKEMDKALDYLERSLLSMQKVNDKFGMAFCYNNLSGIYESKEDYKKANEYNFIALKLFEEIENSEGIAHTCNLLGSTFLKNEQYEQAFKFFKRSLTLAEEIALTELISDNFKELSVYYAAIGDYKQAYTYLELHKVKHDSIYSDNKSQKIANLQNQFEIENREEKIIRLQENKTYQKKITTILVLGLIFGTMVLAFLFFLYREKITEISVRKETEEKLLESEHKFRQLTENVSIAVFTFNMEGKFTYVNPSTTIITGYSEEELLNMKFFDIVHPEHRDQVMARGFDRIKGENVVNKYDFKILTKKGEIRWIEIYNIRTTIDGLVVVLGTATDITERRKADQRILEGEGKYKHLVESIEEGMIIADELENFTFTNKAARKIFGYNDKEMETMNFKEIVSSDDFKRLQLETDKRIKGQSSKYELEIIRKDREKRLISITASPLFDEGDFIGSIGIFVDVTEIRQAEEKIKSQLREKEVMLQEIYHRVKNNLQIISSMLKLQASYVDDEYSIQLFRNCQHRVKSMSLVHEKLYRSDNLSKICFKDYTESLIKNLFASLNISGNRINYELDINDVNLSISMAIPCGLIINELITNALKYGFPDNKQGLIKISMNKLDNGKLNLTVWNNGIDLPKDFDMNNLNSFGMKLVDILKLQLEAELIIERKEGVAFSLIFAIND
ncbi:MAG: PAS domain S-box protein [Candidatus Cloacimonetes bacterium]|nr:PAS domain S-box protein [Candidatus Cloacimonadota bacterium]